MKKIYYYSLLLALAAQCVTYTSCKNDDNEDEITPSNNTEQSSEQNNKEQSSEQNKNVEKFTVTINLNENPLPLVYTEEKGKTININIDELLKNESIKDYLKAYEIFSITENGKEIKDNITLNGDAKIEITALKHADVKKQLPNEEGKILHYIEKYKGVNEEIETVERWAYTKKGKELLYILTRKNYKDKVRTDATNENCAYDSEKGILYHLYNDNGREKTALLEEPKDYESKDYFLKNGDKYYQTSFLRFVKKDNTVKGYQTEWIEEEIDDNKIQKNDIEEPATIESYTITADKFGDLKYEYKDGIITLEDGNKYIYDGTYLYYVIYEYSLIDYTNPFKSDNLLKYQDGIIKTTEAYQIGTITDVFTEGNRIDNTNIYSDYRLRGIYDWDNNSTITYDECNYTYIDKFDTYPFGSFFYVCTIYPDGKIGFFNRLYDYKNNSIFIYNDEYIVIDHSKYSSQE